MWIEWSVPQHSILFPTCFNQKLMHLCVAPVLSESCTVVVYSSLQFTNFSWLVYGLAMAWRSWLIRGTMCNMHDIVHVHLEGTGVVTTCSDCSRVACD